MIRKRIFPPHELEVLGMAAEVDGGVKQDDQRTCLTQLVSHLDNLFENYTNSLKPVSVHRQLDQMYDSHYRHNICIQLNDYLTPIRAYRSRLSSIELETIRDTAATAVALEQTKLNDDMLWEPTTKAPQQPRREAARRAEELKKEEEERAKEAAEKLAKEKSAAAALAAQNVPSTSPAADVSREVQSEGNLIRAAENALKFEEKRLQIYNEFEQRNQSILSGFNMDLRPKEREIARLIKQISGSQDSVRSKASELLKIFNDPVLPQSVTVATFAKKVVSIFETPNANFNTFAFACGHVIVYVSGQVPAVMNLLLAELHKVCMYTVPKHVVNSKVTFQTKERYCKAIGFREEDGNLESMDQYLERLRSYMKLYGALVQTEVQGVHNMHGLEEGWAWLAWFLNALPATLLTAIALEAFLQMAGFALYRKYKDQFRKILNAISHEFVHKLKDSGKPEINSVITRLEDYINSNKFLEEPEGWHLRDTLLSHNADFESQNDGRQQYQQSSYRQQPQYQHYQQSSFSQYY